MSTAAQRRAVERDEELLEFQAKMAARDAEKEPAPAPELAAVVEIDTASAEQEVKTAWESYKKAGEPLGLAFGEKFYNLRLTMKSKGGAGTKGKGLIGFLTSQAIPRHQAYYWMERYEFASGKKTEKEHEQISTDDCLADFNIEQAAQYEIDRPEIEAKQAIEDELWRTTYHAAYGNYRSEHRDEDGATERAAADVAESAANAAAPNADQWLLPEIRIAARDNMRTYNAGVRERSKDNVTEEDFQYAADSRAADAPEPEAVAEDAPEPVSRNRGQSVVLRWLKKLAAELGVNCNIQGHESGYKIVLYASSERKAKVLLNKLAK